MQAAAVPGRLHVQRVEILEVGLKPALCTKIVFTNFALSHTKDDAMRFKRARLVSEERKQCEVCGTQRFAKDDEVYEFEDRGGQVVTCCFECRGRCIVAESVAEVVAYRRV
jgi:hypothetical protein